MIYCEKCGFINSDNSRICVRCFYNLRSSENEENETKDQSKKLRNVNPELEIKRIKKSLEKDNKSISWQNKKCPICENGRITRKKNKSNRFMKQYICSECEAIFSQNDQKYYSLTDVPKDFQDMNKYSEAFLTKKEWIKVAYGLNEVSIDFMSQKNLAIIKNENIRNQESSRFIEVSFYESMPGRLSLGNNSNYIKGILELGEDEIIIHKKSMFRGKDRGTKHIRYDNITSIDHDSGKLLSIPSIQIYLSSQEYSFRSHDIKLLLFYNIIRQKINKKTSLQPVQNTISNISPMDELKKLAELKEMGVVSEEEFELKKKQLLDL